MNIKEAFSDFFRHLMHGNQNKTNTTSNNQNDELIENVEIYICFNKNDTKFRFFLNN